MRARHALPALLLLAACMGEAERRARAAYAEDPEMAAAVARGVVPRRAFTPDALARLAPVAARVEACLARGTGWSRECMCDDPQSSYCHVDEGYVAFRTEVPLAPVAARQQEHASTLIALAYAPGGAPPGLHEFMLGGNFSTLMNRAPSELGHPWYIVFICRECD